MHPLHSHECPLVVDYLPHDHISREIQEKAVQTLCDTAGISREQIAHFDFHKVLWPSASMGLETSEGPHSFKPVEGYQIKMSTRHVSYCVHTNAHPKHPVAHVHTTAVKLWRGMEAMSGYECRSQLKPTERCDEVPRFIQAAAQTYAERIFPKQHPKLKWDDAKATTWLPRQLGLESEHGSYDGYAVPLLQHALPHCLHIGIKSSGYIFHLHEAPDEASLPCVACYLAQLPKPESNRFSCTIL